MRQPAELAQRRREEARRRAVARRQRLGLAALAGSAALAGALIGGGGGDDARPASARCPESILADERRLVGSMLVVRMEDRATEALRRAAREGEIAGVIVFPPAGVKPGRLRGQIAALQRAARAGGNPPLLVMTDQEGGEVKRFPDAPPTRAPGAMRSSDEARDEGEATGRFLFGLGVDVDLAPVLDVPASRSAALASRSFDRDPARVAELGVAFADGLGAAGVAAVPKHFPGLGRAPETTDADPVAIAAGEAALERDLEPFRAAIAAGAPAIMVSLASYPAYGSDRPAALSREIVAGQLRERLGFDGVVITDDLGAAALAEAGISGARAALASARAGVDLLLFALGDGSNARQGLIAAIRRGKLDRAPLEAACGRSVALRTS